MKILGIKTKITRAKKRIGVHLSIDTGTKNVSVSIPTFVLGTDHCLSLGAKQYLYLQFRTYKKGK